MKLSQRPHLTRSEVKHVLAICDVFCWHEDVAEFVHRDAEAGGLHPFVHRGEFGIGYLALWRRGGNVGDGVGGEDEGEDVCAGVGGGGGVVCYGVDGSGGGGGGW